VDTVTITHTAEIGTLATGDTRPHVAIFKAHRWRWSCILTTWYVPHSRDRRPDTDRTDRTAAAITEAGGIVSRDVTDERANTAEREAQRSDRLADRCAGLTARQTIHRLQSPATLSGGLQSHHLRSLLCTVEFIRTPYSMLVPGMQRN